MTIAPPLPDRSRWASWLGSKIIWLVAFGIVQIAAFGVFFLTEYGPVAAALAAAAWGLLNFLWLSLLRRPVLASALALAMIVVLIEVSQFKFGVLWLTATFLDVLIIDQDTLSFLLSVFPHLRWVVLAVAVIGLPLGWLAWRFEPLRVPRRHTVAGAAVCVAVLTAVSVTFPEQGWEPFQGVNHTSNFARSGVVAISTLAAHGWIEASPRLPGDSAQALAGGDDSCKPVARPPHIIMLLDELSFDVAAAPGIKIPEGYEDYFRSFDGKKRSLVMEATGGPTWYAEYNVLAGLSARSYGNLKFFVTRIAAGHIARGLPNALRRCGYRTFSLYPTYGGFLSARKFQSGIGIDRFIDMHDMGVDEDMQPDSFYFDHAFRLIESEKANGPLFIFAYNTANHFPWNTVYRPELTPETWRPPGNDASTDEYIRRQTMTARDYGAFVARLKRDFPDEHFLIVRFGDHQPAISTKLLSPTLDDKALAERIRAYDPLYFTTYYAIDAVNFAPASLSSARDTLEAPYLPVVIQEAAGLPLDPSFAEQKQILQRCKGVFYSCAGGGEARRLTRMLMDRGLIKGL